MTAMNHCPLSEGDGEAQAESESDRPAASPAVRSASLPLPMLKLPAELLDHIDIPLWIKDSAHRYIYASRSYAALLGVTPNDLLGQCDDDVMSSESALACLARDMMALTQDEAVIAQALLQTDGGEPVQGQATVRRLVAEGFTNGTFGWLDLGTDRRDNWEVREQRLLFQFSQAAHEVRSPLAGLVGLSQLLLTDPWLTMKQQRYLTAMDHCAQHLLAVVSDMIDLSRAGAGKVRLALAKVDVTQLFEEIAEWMRPRTDEKRIEFRVTTPAFTSTGRSGNHFMLDGMRLKQVLLNLLSNAVRSTEQGGVELSMRVCPPTASDQAGEVAQAAATRLRFEVTDTGVGMSAEQVSRLFSYEHRFGGAQGKPRSSGSGLGLLISRRLCRAMGGELEVSSAPAHGSIFWFEIDAAECAV